MEEDSIKVPTCSVVITCYNYAHYLAPCLDSLLRQTFRDFEAIVVNDGSTDKTDEVIQPYLKDNRIRYTIQTNRGQANAKNTGIKNARGEFIAFLDADDVWESRKLEQQLPLFKDPQVGVVYSRSRYIDENGKGVDFRLSSKHLRPKSGWVCGYLFFDNFVPFSSSIVRKTCFEQAGLFDETLRMGIDWDLWLRISVSFNFAYVDEPLLIYRLGHAGQMSKNLDERFRCADMIMQKFLNKHPDLLSPWLVRRAKGYALCNRGWFFGQSDGKLSTQFFWSALKNWPFEFEAIKGLIINLVVRQRRIQS